MKRLSLFVLVLVLNIYSGFGQTNTVGKNTPSSNTSSDTAIIQINSGAQPIDANSGPVSGKGGSYHKVETVNVTKSSVDTSLVMIYLDVTAVPLTDSIVPNVKKYEVSPKNVKAVNVAPVEINVDGIKKED